MRVNHVSSFREERWSRRGGEWFRVGLRTEEGSARRVAAPAGIDVEASSDPAAFAAAIPRDGLSVAGDELFESVVASRLLARDEVVDLRLLRSRGATAREGQESVREESDAAVAGLRLGGSRETFVVPAPALDSTLPLLDELLAATSLPPGSADWSGLPILWRNGTAGVLLHEAIGHAPPGRAPQAWPRWLQVVDDPAGPLARLECDAMAAPVKRAQLTGGDPLRTLRAESFRDVPLPRMTNLVASQRSAPFDLPPRRIEALFVRDGHYDAATDRVSLVVSVALLVENGDFRALPPFRLDVPSALLARRIAGATGEPVTFPGVICSAGGQQLLAGTSAPDLLTGAFA